MRATIGVAATGLVLVAAAGAGDTVRGCALPPRVVSARFDASGARYEWTTVCGREPVRIRGRYEKRTGRATQVVVFPARDGASNTFEARCARTPWFPGSRVTCAQVRAGVGWPAHFTEPWLADAALRKAGTRARPVPVSRADRGSPTPLLPPPGATLRTGDPVELRWTSSAGPEALYRLELQRSMSPRGPFSHVLDADVPGTAGPSAGFTIPASVLTPRSHRHWRWRVGQATDSGLLSFSAWQAFALH
ncbi:MAG: hypothetical protein HY217_01070 [Candidatus Rokubacteria bacterium]|nr:hypothetical protein [Candidatus Rokubacteria bacterium]